MCGRTLTVRFSRDRNRIARLLPTLEEVHRDRDHDRGRQSDLDDTKRTLMRRDWLAMPEEGMGLVVHDVHRERDY